MKQARYIGAFAVVALLAACGEREVILTGERLDLHADLAGAEAGAQPLDGSKDVAISLPGAVSQSSWTQRGGNAQHNPGHSALAGALNPLWSARIGQGDDRKHRISADPVAADGRVFTLDSRAQVVATASSGATLWSADLTPPADRQDDGSGGGLAYGAGKVYATTGFGELVALDAASGAVVWRQKFDAPVGGAPTVADGTVYVAARDASAWAVDGENGKVRWQLPATPSLSGVVGGSAPAISGDLVLFPFSSGEIMAVRRDIGVQVWIAAVVGKRLGRTYAGISDLTGDPVVVGNTVYLGNASGRAAAIDITTGQRLWTARQGTMGPIAVVGGALFLVSDEDRLVRLDAATGEEVWAVDLPYFTKKRIKSRRAIYAHYGPILAGGRLILASGDGMLRSFDPASGDATGTVSLPGGATSNPIVVGGTLYAVSRKGQLHAFR
ncbi:MAG: PQQ-binding-like beta-propeller repeat protein [Paracoccaceae bacterium]